MSNRHVQEELLSLWCALARDCATRFPATQVDLDRDIIRLRNAVKQRGITTLVVDLPALGKHLDRCLDSGEYKASGLPLSRGISKAVKIPKFLRGIYLLVFNGNGTLKGDLEHDAVFFLRQLLYFGKKTSLSCPATAVASEVASFADVDSRLPQPDNYWAAAYPDTASLQRVRRRFVEIFGTGGDGNDEEGPGQVTGYPDSIRVKLLDALDKVSRVIVSTLGHFDASHWRFKHGPGAVSDVKGPTNKYCWTNWSPRLERAFPIADYGFHSYLSWSRNIDTIVGEDEPASRLIAVKKTYTKPRLIAAEPRENQWCQQCCWSFFGSRVAGSWIGGLISFRDQTLNQDLCLRGSLTGGLATVDLSAASDRLTPGVVGAFFRDSPSLLDALQSSRTRFVQQDLVKSVPARIELRKFSTMGSACTFPLQSIVFLGVALACTLVKRGLRVTEGNIRGLRGEVAVFGDDIVLPSDCRADLEFLLEVLHFKVNTAKTYSEGNFRESCGVDAFRGRDVTPAYWVSTTGRNPIEIASRIECANNFYSKFLPHASSWVASTIPRGFPYVSARSGVLGLQSRCKPVLPPHKRWNNGLQREEVRILTIQSRVVRTKTNDDSALFQFFTEEPSPMDEWSHGFARRPDIRVKPGWVSLSDL
jgi:hypothetical protein